MLAPAEAFGAIHDNMLWRASDLRWDQYLRRRFKVTPRFVASLMVRAGVDRPDRIGTRSPACGAFIQELDAVSEAVAIAQVNRGDERWFRVQQAIAHLRAARGIVAKHLTPHLPDTVDLHDWFTRLKQLASDLEGTSDARNPHDRHSIGTDANPAHPYGPRRKHSDRGR